MGQFCQKCKPPDVVERSTVGACCIMEIFWAMWSTGKIVGQLKDLFLQCTIFKGCENANTNKYIKSIMGAIGEMHQYHIILLCCKIKLNGTKYCWWITVLLIVTCNNYNYYVIQNIRTRTMYNNNLFVMIS